MRISLTRSQREALLPFVRGVRSAAEQGRPGMLLAQVCWEAPLDEWWLEVGFLPHELAKAISERAAPEAV